MKLMLRFFSIILVSILLASCSLFPVKSNFSTSESYLDLSWTSLETEAYSFKTRTGTPTESSLALSFRGFSGEYSVWEINTKESVEIDFAIIIGEHTKGSLKVSMVAQNGGMESLIEDSGSFNGSVPFPAGTYKIVLIGLDATGGITMDIDVPQGVEVLVLQ
jgi:hypothetical protein